MHEGEPSLLRHSLGRYSRVVSDVRLCALDYKKIAQLHEEGSILVHVSERGLARLNDFLPLLSSPDGAPANILFLCLRVFCGLLRLSMFLGRVFGGSATKLMKR